MLCMCDPAWYIFIRCIQLSCVMLFCAFMLLLSTADPVKNYPQYMTALSLYETPQGILLLGIIFSVCLEDLHSRRS